jgi:glycerol-3-phosphate dehydrogenase
LSSIANGTGGFVTLYGGKLTTHRALAEEVLDELQRLGAATGGPWTKNVPLWGGTLSRPELLARAAHGPEIIPLATRRRWALTYGDQIEALFAIVAAESTSAAEVAQGVPRAELDYAAATEDAMTAEDFLLRRTKLQLTLDQAGRNAVADWFSHRAG